MPDMTAELTTLMASVVYCTRSAQDQTTQHPSMEMGRTQETPTVDAASVVCIRTVFLSKTSVHAIQKQLWQAAFYNTLS